MPLEVTVLDIEDQFSGKRSLAMRDILAFLGAAPGAAPEEITAAYRALVRSCHPDLGGDEDAMKKINAAYDEIRPSLLKRDAAASGRPAPAGESRREQASRATAKGAPAAGRRILPRRAAAVFSHAGRPSPLQAEGASAHTRQGRWALAIAPEMETRLEEAIETARKAEAARRASGARKSDGRMWGPGRQDSISGFRRATEIRLDGRIVRIHLDAPAAHGLNLLAVPKLLQRGDNISVVREVETMAIEVDRGGRAVFLEDASRVVSGASSIRLELVFPGYRKHVRRPSAMDAR